MFLNVTATVANWSADNMECSLILDDNPLVDFVELPETCQGLSYCNILCGVLRGALEMVRFLLLIIKFVLKCLLSITTSGLFWQPDQQQCLLKSGVSRKHSGCSDLSFTLLRFGCFLQLEFVLANCT